MSLIFKRTQPSPGCPGDRSSDLTPRRNLLVEGLGVAL